MTPIIKVKPSLHDDDGGDAGAVAAATLAAKRQKKAIKTGGYKVSNNLAPPPKQVLRSTLLGGDLVGGSPMKAAVLSQEEDAVKDGTDSKEPSNKVGSWGDDPDARVDDVEYNDNVDARGAGSGLRHGMAEFEVAMTKPRSTGGKSLKYP
jgi:hypothetical protein